MIINFTLETLVFWFWMYFRCVPCSALQLVSGECLSSYSAWQTHFFTSYYLKSRELLTRTEENGVSALDECDQGCMSALQGDTFSSIRRLTHQHASFSLISPRVFVVAISEYQCLARSKRFLPTYVFPSSPSFPPATQWRPHSQRTLRISTLRSLSLRLLSKNFGF